MKTLERITTDHNTQPNSEEKIISNTSILVDLGEVREQCLSNERIANKRSIISVKSIKDEKNDKHKTYGLAFNLISSMLLILIGIIVLNVTGLYAGMNSTAGKVTLCIVISCSYLIAFRRGLYFR